MVFKPYPCNHFTHAGVDAALRLRAQGLAPADVTALALGVAKPVLRTIAEPPEAKARPASGYHAAFSGRYTVAAALLGGGPGNPLSDEELARKFHDNAVRSLPEERAAELAARTLALPDAQSVEDLTALLTSAGER
jgi:2-methylcitrate dehydratase PrpD